MRKFSRHRPAQYMSLSSVEILQAYFGFTQQDMAILLGVSRTTLAMHGRPGTAVGSERSMPSAAILRLVSLLPNLPPPYGSATEPPAEPAPELADYERKKLKWRLTEIAIAEYPLQEKLERCQNRLAQARRCLHALPTLRAALPDE